MKKLVGFYHIYLSDDPGTWTNMIFEQFKIMEDYGLLHSLNELNVTAIGKLDERYFLFDELVKLYYPKANIHLALNPNDNDKSMLRNIEDNDNATENVTIRKIFQKANQDDCHILYFHSKGITSLNKHYKVNEMSLLRNYQYWRYYLNWGVLENWKKCVDSLETYDVAGVNYFTYPAKHFSGAFWWANSDYIKRLPDPSTKEWWYELKSKAQDFWLRNASDRFRDEQWLCCLDDVKVFTVDKNNNNPATDNPANFYLPRKEYRYDQT